MKVVFISSLAPSGHYSQYLTAGLNQQKNLKLIVYAGKKEKINLKKNGRIKQVWSKSFKYIFEILWELKKDKPDIVHVQQELNMYGGIVTSLLFPILILLVRMSGYKVITTIHAAVFKKQINDEFINLFHQNSKIIRPSLLKIFFHYIFKFCSLFSNALVIHTNRKKKILLEDYGVSKSKINVMPIIIPNKKIKGKTKGNYFFYFGYMVRRKGLEFALRGFKNYYALHPKSNFKLILAGGIIKGQEKALEEIKSFINHFNLVEKVIIKGFIEEKNLDELYTKAYAVIIPAKVSMGSSGPLFHAMSYGKCVITSREGYFLEDIKHLKTGILTSNSEWDEVYNFAVKNPKKIKQIEKNVLTKAASQKPNLVANKYVQLYKSL